MTSMICTDSSIPEGFMEVALNIPDQGFISVYDLTALII